MLTDAIPKHESFEYEILQFVMSAMCSKKEGGKVIVAQPRKLCVVLFTITKRNTGQIKNVS